MSSDLVVKQLRTGGDRLAAVIVAGRTVLAMGDQALGSGDGKTFQPREHLGRVQAMLVDGDAIYAVGESFGVSRDRGATWTKIEVPVLMSPAGVPGLMMCIHKHSDGRWLIGGYGGILVSKSPLKGWKLLLESSKVGQISEHFGKAFVGGYDTGMLSGDAITILKALHARGSWCDGFFETPKGTLLAYGERMVSQIRYAAVYRSVDRGKSWKPVEVPFERDLFPQHAALVTGAIILVGDAGSILRSTDDGKTFTKVPGGGTQRLWAIASWGTGAMIVGDGGTVLKLAAPKDPYWRGAADALPAVPEPSIELRAAPTAEQREAAFARLFADATKNQPKLARTDIEKARDEEDTDDAVAVHADTLPDPRGKLAAIQIRRTTKPKDKKLIAAERDLLRAHRKELLGAFGEATGHRHVKLAWRGGFIDSAWVGWTWALDKTGGSVVELVRALLAEPSARFLRELTIGGVENNSYAKVAKLIAAAPRPSLRSLHLGDSDGSGSEEWMALGDLGALWPALPNLRHLKLHAVTGMLGTIVLPRLETCEVDTARLASAIVSARWPSLRSLRVHGTATVDDLAPALTWQTLPRLAELAIAYTTDEQIATLAASPILPQLAKLDLSDGHLTDEGAAMLSRTQRSFAHLETLILDDNYISPAGKKLVAKSKLSIRWGKQRSSDC